MSENAGETIDDKINALQRQHWEIIQKHDREVWTVAELKKLKVFDQTYLEVMEKLCVLYEQRGNDIDMKLLKVEREEIDAIKKARYDYTCGRGLFPGFDGLR